MREAGAMDLHGLALEVTRPPGAPAWYGDDPERERVEEWIVAGEPDAVALRAHLEARGPQSSPRIVALAIGTTGLDVYRNAAIAAKVVGAGRVRVRVRWSDRLGIKAAALALLFGADELVGPLAPRELSRRIAIVGGPPEDPACPTRAHVEALIRAAGRTPVRLDAPPGGDA